MTNQKHQQKLLETYAPILKFSAGERFFPMDVQDFVKDAKLYKAGDKNYEKEGNIIFEGQLERNGREHYLQYIPSKPFFEKIIWRDLLLMVLMIITIAVGIQTEQIPEFADDLNLTRIDYIKICFLFGVALAGVILQGRRIVYFSFAFFFTALFFYGHIVGIGLGYLSVLGLIFLGTVRWYSTRRSAKKHLEYSLTYWAGREITIYDEYVAFGLGILATFIAGFLTFWFGFPRLGYDPSLPICLPLTNLCLPQWIILLVLMIIGPIIAVVFWKRLEIVATIVSLCYLGINLFIHDAWMVFDSILRSSISALIIIICILTALKLLKLFDLNQTPRLQESLKSLVKITKPKNLSNRALLLVLAWIAFWWIGTFFSFELFNNTEWITPRTIVIYPLVYFLAFLISMLILTVIGIVLNGGDFIRWYMDLRSSAPDVIADEAWRKYEDGSKKSVYYGHVETYGKWTSLQYHFFYAFNDWRSKADGLNHHEGDWESAAIFLETTNPNEIDFFKRYTPFGVACSQHEEGEFRFWDEVELEDSHPVIYPALGSHANYFVADTYPTAFQFSGLLRKIVGYIDRVMQEYGKNLGTEVALGDGKLIDINDVHIEQIDDDKPNWVRYQGLWGRITSVKHESGPRGPKWEISEEDRENVKTEQEETRPRWKLHEWKDRLLFKMVHESEAGVEKRRRALTHLTER